ncbi:aminotransferase class I/II-fold pyridoxal phosphate-dependent enzyme [Fodinisporobacter ferrooxydans]|uniref:Aminotransferase class I/II-fold pyridoxal phosphate-dependent enzyme n=1 Tax=Fodinisporobacter ferrooxydans TaxID=2901836 RepID=A0ABY4CHC1_9BACL|nr:aminotransferase class I/II-fold pyridoxal phosphate-dependent enzyme [Alicyclobacillaceae bacterium MYW30-H2]
MNLETKLAQIGNRKDPATGAFNPPIHHSTTYRHPRLGESTGFDYTRTKNPTRQILEDAIADLEGGVRGFAYASGMAAVVGILTLFQPGDHLVLSDDLYGGTYRVMEQMFRQYGISGTYVDTGDLSAVRDAISENTKAVFIETPTNPLMKITDLRGVVKIAQEHDILTIVDNTFLSPYFQRPLELGADIVFHSATKYLGGHNDVLAGLVVAKSEDLAERLFFLQNSIGAVLGPQDCWLVMRGMKTLALRMQRHDANARILAEFLQNHPKIEKVLYPGLADHPGHLVQAQQSTGFGGMISFYVKKPEFVPQILERIQLIAFAESLGGPESMITFPARQTHADIPEDVRNAIGVTDTLLRFSVGLEHSEDLLADLEQALR